MNKKPIVLIVLDGWGYREDTKNNAIATANKPFWDNLWKTYPHSLLKASGNAVGLPEGQMGNSEVGHMTMGAGKPIDTDLVRIDKAIKDGSFDTNSEFEKLFTHVKNNDSTLHVIGLIGPGGVHSHQDHLIAFLRLAKKREMKKVAIHIITDGRDTPPQSAAGYAKELEDVLVELGPSFFIASISGRYYSMDRDKNWDRLAKYESVLFDGKGYTCDTTPSVYIEEQYKLGKSDEYLEPAVCRAPVGMDGKMKKNDGAFFFNFRADRARMLTEKIIERQATENILLVTMTVYDINFKCNVAFPMITPKTTLGQEVSSAGLKQVHIAETEKFAHATYFLNGGRETPYEGEQDILIPSRKDIKTHDQAPRMRAEEIASKAIEEINAGTDFMFINFANADMVGHTSVVPAIIEAIETLDTQLKRVVEALTKVGGIALITADHGNAEVNIDPETGIRHTAHTTSPVPCILTSHDYRLNNGGLSDVAPTILKLLDIKIPSAMTGKPLIS
jgi:2,3-bisphosphoglycerate-independent phosphoglycerate mutase